MEGNLRLKKIDSKIIVKGEIRMKRALIKTIQYLLLGVILLFFFKFRGDTDITPHTILLVVCTAILFLIYLFIEKRKEKKLKKRIVDLS